MFPTAMASHEPLFSENKLMPGPTYGLLSNNCCVILANRVLRIGQFDPETGLSEYLCKFIAHARHVHQMNRIGRVILQFLSQMQGAYADGMRLEANRITQSLHKQFS
jgi:hypothetical protein